MSKTILSLLAAIVFISCNNNKTGNGTSVHTDTSAAAAVRSSDTLVISSQAIVYFRPSTKKIEKERKAMGEDDFNTASDDMANYMAEATTFLDSACKADRIETYICNGDSVRAVRFLLSNSSVLMTLPDTLTELEGVYFFDPAGRRYAADITDISAEYQRFF